MKNIGIVFHPQNCSDEMPKAEKLLEATAYIDKVWLHEDDC